MSVVMGENYFSVTGKRELFLLLAGKQELSVCNREEVFVRSQELFVRNRELKLFGIEAVLL